MLGYAKPENAIAQHCKGTLKRGILTDGGKQLMNCVPEGDLYRLIVNSHLPAAEKFESWVFDEVLPSIRKTGKYEKPSAPSQPRLGEINTAARIITQELKDAGMPPQFRAVVLKNLYEPAGLYIPLDGIAVSKKTYDLTAIANMLGVTARKSGRPHGQAIGAVIQKVGVSDDEKVLVPFQNTASGHSGENWQYTDNVVGKVSLWLQRNDYPPEIPSGDKSYKVAYTRHNS